MDSKKLIKRIIISCKTNIGDVVAALPVAGLLKKHYPDCEITLLARDYVKDMTTSLMDVDNFLSIDELKNVDELRAVEILKSTHADIFINLIPDKKIAYLAKKSGIKIRLGTARRWYHFLYCNRIVWMSRHHPTKHESEFNVKMLSSLKVKHNYAGEELIPFIRLKPVVSVSEDILKKIDKDRFNLIIHPGTNNHTKEWPIYYFQELILSLSKHRFNIFLTGTQKEFDKFNAHLLDPFPHVHNMMGTMTLSELISFIHSCDGMLVGSTGPAHLSAALEKNTLALYPCQIGRNPDRWRPLGVNAHYLMAPGICGLCAETPKIITDTVPGCTCMDALPVEQVKKVLEGWQSKQVNFSK